MMRNAEHGVQKYSKLMSNLYLVIEVHAIKYDHVTSPDEVDSDTWLSREVDKSSKQGPAHGWWGSRSCITEYM